MHLYRYPLSSLDRLQTPDIKPTKLTNQRTNLVLEFSIFVTRISSAPTNSNLSIVSAIILLSTITLTATHPSSSSGLTEGALLPGVILLAASSFERSILYVHSTNFCAVITPRIREAINSMSFGSDGCFDFMRTAVDSTTVEIAFKPATRIVSPDSDVDC